MNDTTTAGDALRTLIARWRDDAGGTYRSWFLWEERLKNFRSIRRGLEVVVAEIEQSRFASATSTRARLWKPWSRSKTLCRVSRHDGQTKPRGQRAAVNAAMHYSSVP